MEKVWESWYPYVFAIISGGIVYLLKLEISDVEKFDLILNASVTISSIIIAFLGTMISILLTLTSAKVMQRIREHGAENSLTSYISQTIVVGLILALYSMSLFMFLEYNGEFSNALLTTFVVLLTFLFVSSFRIMNLIAGILKSVLSEKNEEDARVKVYTPSIYSGREEK